MPVGFVFALIKRMKLTLIKNVEIYTPDPIGKSCVLYCDSKIFEVGDIDEKALLKTKLDVEIIDAKNDILIPGIIDPHAHLLGGSGENEGFSSQTPEISLTELTTAGITTVVGTLGADTKMKTMPGLLAKAKGLNDQGLSAYIYTGGYTVPPTTIMDNAKEDIMFIDEVIATGEIAIADERSNEPEPRDLSKVIVDSYLGGMLSNKAGVTHFHVGEGKRKLQCIFDTLEYAPEIKVEWIYPTHIERTEALIKKAVELARKGCFVDMDVSEGNLAKSLRIYFKNGGKADQLTISSDASIASPKNIISEVRDCILHHRFSLEKLLPLITRNTAKVLKLKTKGEIKKDFDASFVVLDKKNLQIRHVISKGKIMVKDGHPIVQEKFLEGSNRAIHLEGDSV